MNTKAKKLIATAVVSVAAIASTVSYAFPTRYIEMNYYSDASKTQIVGVKTLTCTGHNIYEGQKTQYTAIAHTFLCPKDGIF